MLASMALRRGVTALLISGVLTGAGVAPAQAAQVADARCDSWSQFSSDSPAWAQTFTAEHTGPLTKARFYISTTTTASLEVSIHTVDTDTGLPTGAALATRTLTDVPARPNIGFTPLADNFVDVSFSSGAQVTAGGFYALTVKRVSPSANLTILTASPSAPEGPCAGVLFKDANVDGTWESYGAAAWANLYDMAMVVYVGDSETAEPPPSGGGGPLPEPPKPSTPPFTPPSPTVSISGTSLFFVNGQTCQVVTRVNGAGKVTVSVYGNAPLGASATAKKKGKGKRYAIGKKTVRTAKAGDVKLSVPISRAARNAIAGKGKLKATLEVTFTPAGGGKATKKKKSITLKPKPRKKR
jgi:hypothetical protein